MHNSVQIIILKNPYHKKRTTGGIYLNQKLKEKIVESLSSVLPVTCIVLILCITITPMPLDPLMLFLVGATLLTVGMGFFTLGVDMSMMIIGEKAGSHLAKSKKLPLIVFACFIIGFIISGNCIFNNPVWMELIPFPFDVLCHTLYYFRFCSKRISGCGL